MGTPGLVTVICEDDVLFKISVDCNGEFVEAFADEFKDRISSIGNSVEALEEKLQPEEIVEMIDESYFGCYSCLVVATRSGLHGSAMSGSAIDPKYAKNFNVPNLHPVHDKIENVFVIQV